MAKARKIDSKWITSPIEQPWNRRPPDACGVAVSVDSDRCPSPEVVAGAWCSTKKRRAGISRPLRTYDACRTLAQARLPDIRTWDGQIVSTEPAPNFNQCFIANGFLGVLYRILCVFHRLAINLENHVASPQTGLVRWRARIHIGDQGALNVSRDVQLRACVLSEILNRHAVQSVLARAV